jgi:predicted transposase/invertase (TIGR01784 family)
MPLGIRPINDFAFKKVFGTAENRDALISLLDAILQPRSPIVDVAILNPFNLQDFRDDKLSILDVKAIDQSGAIYDVEIQLQVSASLPQRIVFYGCQLVADQLREGDKYAGLQPVYSIWLINGVVWPETTQVHHAFQLTDRQSGRVLDETLAIHTLELPKYNLTQRDLADDDMLGCWLCWLKHAQEYDVAELRKAFPQEAIRHATETLRRIAEISEDKIMYDARERAIRDRKWDLADARREGEIKGKIETIHMLEGLLNLPLSDEKDLAARKLEQLDALANDLRENLRNRIPS